MELLGSTFFDRVSESLRGPTWLISAKAFLWLPNPSAIYNNLSNYNHFSAPDPVQAVFGGVPPICLRSVTFRGKLQLALYTPVCSLPPPSRAFFQDFGRNTFWRVHCMPMLHYMKDLIILISSHTDTIGVLGYSTLQDLLPRWFYLLLRRASISPDSPSFICLSCS